MVIFLTTGDFPEIILDINKNYYYKKMASSDNKTLGACKDPKYIGPGCWFTLHTMAAHATTPELMKFYAWFIRLFCKEFRCANCAGHCQDYMKKNPPEKYFHIKNSKGRYVGCLRHSVDFHNTANTFLRKPTYDYETVENFYIYPSDDDICEEGCGEHPTEHPKERHVTQPGKVYPSQLLERAGRASGDDATVEYLRKLSPNLVKGPKKKKPAFQLVSS